MRFTENKIKDMPKLNKYQIELIDRQLHNLGIEFKDIRYEMVDHIASELEEKEGDFDNKWTEYFIMNRLQLLKQNQEAKQAAIVRSLKYYFRTLSMPGSMALFTGVFATVYFYAKYYVERFDLSLYGNCILFMLILPFAIVSWKNKKISVMRSMTQIYTAIYFVNLFVMLITSFIDDREARILPQRFSISFMAAFMVILIISLYRCRQQYVGKYI